MPWVSTHQSKTNFSNFLHFPFDSRCKVYCKRIKGQFLFFLAKTTRDIVVQNTKPFRAKRKHWRINMGRKKLYRLFAMYCGSCSLASYRLDRLENSLLTDLQAERDADFVRAFLIAIAKEMSKNVFHLCLMLLPAYSMASALHTAGMQAQS